MATNPAVRISRLRALIDHPRTGSSERDTAQRMLNRILRTSRPITDAHRQYGSGYSRLGRHAGLDSIAEMIRDDITMARTNRLSAAELSEVAPLDPVANAPKDIQIDVDVLHDCEIVVTISCIPTAWGWCRDGGIDVYSPALRALVDELASIVDSFDHSGEDITNRFFGRVRVGDTTVVW
ncbi:hypothetical protein CH275_01015 [Rhodococcus sp. 06-235-1A]|uniref:hypothetical protein n=1 Tax=Rhodococcus sp. 06-235-1A TaxID=2022508 RepID=UPI000B9ABC29|nr:hypothetical protein [Rhodococcus sp. 06-235-1A]OZD10292.1 hypothetical protein CH275_01015 [Rhodococcus sp. 06-235-1A]